MFLRAAALRTTVLARKVRDPQIDMSTGPSHIDFRQDRPNTPLMDVVSKDSSRGTGTKCCPGKWGVAATTASGAATKWRRWHLLHTSPNESSERRRYYNRGRVKEMAAIDLVHNFS